MSLTKRVTIVVIIIIAIVFLPFMFFGVSSLKEENEKLIKQQIKDCNIVFLNSYEQIIEAQMHTSIALSDVGSMMYENNKYLDSASLQQNISRVLNKFLLDSNADGTIYSISLLFEPNVFGNAARLNAIQALEDINGYIINPRHNRDYTIESAYLTALPSSWDRSIPQTQRLFIDPNYETFDPVSNSIISVLSLASPIYDNNGTIVGVALINLDLRKLSTNVNIALQESFDIVFEEQGEKPDLKLLLLSSSTGTIVLHTNQEKIGKHVDNYDERILFDKRQINYDNKESMISVDNIEYRAFPLSSDLDTESRMFVLMSDDYFPDYRENVQRLLTYVMIIFIISSALAAFTINYIIKYSLRSVRKTIDNIEKTINNRDFGVEYIELNSLSINNTVAEIITWNTTLNKMLQQLMFDLSKQMNILLSQSSDVVSEIENTMGAFQNIADKVGTFSKDILTQKVSINAVSEDINFSNKSIDTNLEKINDIRSKSNELNECLNAQPTYASSINTVASDMKNSLNDIENTLKNLLSITKSREEVEETNKEHIKLMDDNAAQLSRSITSMAEFVSSITEISVQTNMLAMNASIEAAHAGEHGKGFAVVAEEIRKLSYMSSKYAENANDSLKDITKRLNFTINEFKLRNEYFIETVKVTNQINKSVESLNETNYSVSALSESIKTSSNELSSITKRATLICKDLTSSIDNSKKDLTTLKTLSNSTTTSIQSLQNIIENGSLEIEKLDNTITDVRSSSKNITNLIINRTENIKAIGEQIRSYNIPDLDLIREISSEEERESMYVTAIAIIKMTQDVIDNFGPEAFEKLIKYLPPEISSIIRNYKNIDKKSFFLLEESVVLQNAIVDLFYDGNQEVGYKIAREHFDNQTPLLAQVILKMLPKEVLINKFISESSKMYIGFKLEVVKSRRDHTIIQIRNIAKMSLFSEHAMRGSLDAMVAIKKNGEKSKDNTNVIQTHSLAKGDMYIEYIVYW